MGRRGEEVPGRTLGYIYIYEIADIVDNISVGLECRGNNQ